MGALKQVRGQVAEQRFKVGGEGAGAGGTTGATPPPMPSRPDPKAKFEAKAGQAVSGDISQVVGGASDKPLPKAPQKIQPKGAQPEINTMGGLMAAKKRAQDKIKDKEQEKLLDIIIKNARKLKNLTEDILDVTKIEGNTLNLNKEEFRIRDLLQPIIKEFEHCLEKSRAIKFELHLKNIDPNFIVVADQNRITQVISNLINNSIKFISKEDGNENVDGLISISVEKIKINDIDNDDKVIINIKDNGEGINQEIFPRLFTKFASKSFQGTGLGLFIAKNIIEAHGGKIWAKNNEGGKGAIFSFILPVFNK